MYVLAMEVDLRILDAHSLKDKRHVVKSVVEGAPPPVRDLRRRGRRPGLVAAVPIGFAVVASSAKQAEEVLDDVDRFVWAQPGVEILSAERAWLE